MEFQTIDNSARWNCRISITMSGGISNYRFQCPMEFPTIDSNVRWNFRLSIPMSDGISNYRFQCPTEFPTIDSNVRWNIQLSIPMSDEISNYRFQCPMEFPTIDSNVRSKWKYRLVHMIEQKNSLKTGWTQGWLAGDLNLPQLQTLLTVCPWTCKVDSIQSRQDCMTKLWYRNEMCCCVAYCSSRMKWRI